MSHRQTSCVSDHLFAVVLHLNGEDGLREVSCPKVEFADAFLNGERAQDEAGSRAVRLQGAQEGSGGRGRIGAGEPTEVDSAGGCHARVVFNGFI